MKKERIIMNWYKIAQTQQYLWNDDPQLPYANISKKDLDNLDSKDFNSSIVLNELKHVDKNESFQNFLNFYGIKVYHGTNYKFNKFSLKYFGSTDEGFAGKGLYFTTNKNYAKEYGDIIKEAYIRLSNPLIINNSSTINPNYIKRKLNLPESVNADTVTKTLVSNGYDGVIINYDETPDFPGSSQGFEIVVFDPTKVKTTEQLFDLWNKRNELV
jgi:hypothetical protein